MGNIRFAIKDEVENLLSEAIEVNIAVALCSNYAVNALQNIPKSCKLRIVTGVDLPTPLEVLRALKSRYKKKARIYAETFFHPKVYIFRLKNKELVAYIGSGNFTEGGLLNNIEVFYKVEDQDECNNISGWFENVFNKSLCITDNFLIEYKGYSRKWSKEENKRKSEIKDLLNDVNDRMQRTEGDTLQECDCNTDKGDKRCISGSQYPYERKCYITCDNQQQSNNYKRIGHAFVNPFP